MELKKCVILKVLFVSRDKGGGVLSTIVLNQGESLLREGVEVDYFLITGRGIWSYIKAIWELKRLYNSKSFDVVHAHYSYSAISAVLAGRFPVVASLMGSDVKGKVRARMVLKYFINKHWSRTIVKSLDSKLSIGLGTVSIIPNGVDISRFRPINQKQALRQLNWDESCKHVLFASDPNREVKNFGLAKEALDLLKSENIQLHFLKGIDNSEVPLYMNASDVVLLTSLWEGSPNVIKEAMACNANIVSTVVGDVKKLFEGVTGCFLVKFDKEDIKSNIERALYEGPSNGLERIITLGLDSRSVAKRLLDEYELIQNMHKGT